MKEQLDYLKERLSNIKTLIQAMAQHEFEEGTLLYEDFVSGMEQLNTLEQSLLDRFVFEKDFSALNAIRLFEGVRIQPKPVSEEILPEEAQN